VSASLTALFLLFDRVSVDVDVSPFHFQVPVEKFSKTFSALCKNGADDATYQAENRWEEERQTIDKAGELHAIDGEGY
jgi:hypothetical protein